MNIKRRHLLGMGMSTAGAACGKITNPIAAGQAAVDILVKLK